MSEAVYFGGEEFLEEMRRRGLTPPAALAPPEAEFPRIVGGAFHVERANLPFFQTVKMDVQWAENAPLKPFFVTSNYGPGAVALVVVDGLILFVRQWRVSLGVETEEIPRGFSEKWDSGKQTGMETLPKFVSSNLELRTSAHTALREAAEETKGDFGKIVPVYIGHLWQNSGTETNRPGFWLLKIEGYRLNKSSNLRLLTLQEAEDQVSDMHSAAALTMYRRFIRQIGRAHV